MVIRSSQMTGICVGRPSDNSIVVCQMTCCCLFNDWDDGHLTLHDMYQLCFNLRTEHIHSTCSVLVMTSGHVFDNSLRPSCSLWSFSGPIPSVKSDLYSLNNLISMCGLQCTSVLKKCSLIVLGQALYVRGFYLTDSSSAICLTNKHCKTVFTQVSWLLVYVWLISFAKPWA